MTARKKPAPKVVPVTEETKDQVFLDAYTALCEKHRRSLMPVPGWRFSQDGNDHRMTLQMQVQRLPSDVNNK